MRLRRFLPATALAVLALAQPVAASAGTATVVDVLAVGAAADDQVSLVAALRPAPAQGPPRVSVTGGGEDLPTQVQPVLSEATALGLVVDASAAGTSALQGGGLSGVAGFLLQVPAGAATTVVADRRPPAVLATPPTGVNRDLQAVSALTSAGERDTSAALELVLRRLPPRPARQPVVVLYTAARDAGGQDAADLGERVRRADAVLAVVSTHPDLGYWSRAAAATGGLALRTEPAQAIQAFDQVADALRGRYLVTFPRPAAPGELTLRVQAAGAVVETPVALPPPATTSQAADAADAAGSWRPLVVAVVLVLLVLLLVLAGALVMRRRRRATAGEPDEDVVEVPASPPDGVRVFDLTEPGSPREVTGSLFEPRQEREARERAEQARERAEQG